jgi:flagellar biosynthesis/type III secretory pathway M-ring protein FliF/YscJ
MDAFRELLERNAQAIVIFAACLACIFFVIRPLSMALIEFLHRRKIEEMKKEAAIRPPKPADNEMGELLGKAAAMGLTDQERLRRLARSNPDEAKDVVRNWIYR